ncbi:MAG: HEPN domain-containing protein [Nitrospirota bacterium]
MTGEHAAYRLRMATGFLGEAQQDVSLGRWRSAVDNAQLAAENGVKAVLSLTGPVGRTHAPTVPLREALARGEFPPEFTERLHRLIEHAEMLGHDVHVQTDYGDEAAGRTPWELFTENDARRAVAEAEQVV